MEGELTCKGVTFRAIESSEMYAHPEHEPDKCAMYRWEMDGISIGHMGDVGNPFTPEEYEFFRDLDVFLVLAGDVPTIDLGDLKQVIDRVGPKLVIPMALPHTALQAAQYAMDHGFPGPL